jgi:hypothetical protein
MPCMQNKEEEPSDMYQNTSGYIGLNMTSTQPPLLHTTGMFKLLN